MTQAFIILHTNDIHGRIEGLARITTLVDQTRIEHSDIPVLYFDIGDIEENSVRISNLTKGAAMHRLLSVSGCDAEAMQTHCCCDDDGVVALRKYNCLRQRG